MSASAAISLLRGLLADAQDLADLRPRVVAEAKHGHGSLDVSLNVPAPGDEGLELGLEVTGHASRLVDATGARQEVLTPVVIPPGPTTEERP